MAVTGYRLRLNIEGVDETHALLQGMAGRARDARPVLRTIQRLMQETAEEQFISEGAASGNPWEEDKQDTRERKEAEGADLRTEIRTGELARSLLGSSDQTIRRLTNTYVAYGTRIFYARYQGKKRTLLMMTTKDANYWSELLVNYIMGGHKE